MFSGRALNKTGGQAVESVPLILKNARLAIKRRQGLLGKSACIVITTCLLTTCFIPVGGRAEPVQPLIDLSSGQADLFSADDEYRPIRPGAMDDRFKRGEAAGDTEIKLGYDDQTDIVDEYGVVREQPGKDTAPTFTP